MAWPTRRLATNALGAFDVDVACIDCGTDWPWDPQQFGSGAQSALVHRPPCGPREQAMALLAQWLWPLAAIVLTHRDDVVDHVRWPARFGCSRWIHAADAETTPGAQRHLEGERELRLDAGLRLLSIPGHTAGSLVALLGTQILVSGEPLWRNWSARLAAVQRLRVLAVHRLLPAHGGRRACAAAAWGRHSDQILAFCRDQP